MIPLPPEIREAIIELAQALARTAARRDHAQAESEQRAAKK